MAFAEYHLRCCGAFTTPWLAEFLSLFQTHMVSIRKLLLIESFDQPGFSRLEIRFALPPENQGDILNAVESCLKLLPCETLWLDSSFGVSQ